MFRAVAAKSMRGGGLGKEIVRTGVLPRYRGGAFVCHYMIVNRGPAKGCVWPVIAPAEGIVRAGAVLRGDAALVRGAAFVLCRSCVSIGMSCARSRPSYVPAEVFYARSRLLFAAYAPNRTACGMLRSYSAVGRDRHSYVLESLVRLSRMVGLIWACAFPYGDLDGGRRDARDRERSRR